MKLSVNEQYIVMTAECCKEANLLIFEESDYLGSDNH